MKELRQYIERELRGPDSYFGVERSADELELLLDTQTDVCRSVADELGAGAKNIYLVGAGGSLANLRPLKQIFDSLLECQSRSMRGTNWSVAGLPGWVVARLWYSPPTRARSKTP